MQYIIFHYTAFVTELQVLFADFFEEYKKSSNKAEILQESEYEYSNSEDQMKLHYVATCLFGLEKTLGEELDALGLARTETMDGRVFFEGDESALARASIGLRCAERVLLLLGRFPAESFDALFEGTKALPWEDWIGRNDAFPVKGHAIKSKLHSLPDCQSIVKKAVVDRLSGAYGQKWFAEAGVKYQIEFFIFKDVAHLMIDTSGVTLHKRGYRPDAGEAPLRETLAAALAYNARPRADVLFWDPMCGSGTIAIEAAMILSNRAPGLGRTFAAEDFPQIPRAVWADERARAEAAILHDADYEVWASDIDEEILDVTYENALRAGVEDRIRIFNADVRKIEKPDRRGTIVCNPPYGERLMTPETAAALYREMGNHLRTFAPWHLYVITSNPQFERLFGHKADKVRKLYNGMIPCNLYQYFKYEQRREGRGGCGGRAGGTS